MTGRHYRQAAAAWYEEALRALCKNSIAEHAAGIGWETQEFLALNREAGDARRGVSWWRQRLIVRRVVRELDYWNRMGGTG